ncbi:uncharacterized protein [Ptychodera flava]|uniref:uncharacterized protein n=1 Tax=Ptychodera flava TaxID=63121 RepID=UPI003969F076
MSCRIFACLFVLLLSFLIVLSQENDVYGTVNVGVLVSVNGTNSTLINSSPQLFTITENDEQGFLPVYLLIYNGTEAEADFDPSLITGDIMVFCEISTTYSEGDTVVDFYFGLIEQGSTTDEVQYIPISQGRSVEVQCSGEYFNVTADHDLFNMTTSAGFPGYVGVQKSPIVSFCSDVITVPNEEIPYRRNPVVPVILSEEVTGSNVTISCEVSQIVSDTVPLLLWFEDVLIEVGGREAFMEYEVLQKGDPVLVQCTAQSENGTQFLTNTSSGDEAMFRLDVGDVQLIPVLNKVRQTELITYLVLDDPISVNSESVTFTCVLTSADSTESAREIADNPTCEPYRETRPTNPEPQPTNSTNGTSSVAPTTTPPTTVPTTIGDLTTIGYPANVSTFWYMEFANYEFNQGDLFKTVVLKHPPSVPSPIQELVVVTCCAPPENNANPKYINETTALLMVVDLTKDIAVNWTLASDSTNKETETVINNPAYVELAPCECDMTRGSCDTNCCCDTDCTEDELETFSSCIPGLEGGQEGDPYEYVCENVNIYTPDWHPLLCIEMYSTPYLGLYYDTKFGIRTMEGYRNTLATTEDGYDYADPGRRYGQDSGVTSAGYKQGVGIRTAFALTNQEGYLSLPTPSASVGTCSWMSPIQYLVDANSSCVQLPTQSLCSAVSFLSAQMYVMSSRITHPPCPPVATVVRNHGNSKSAATVLTNYYCTDDITPFLASNVTIEDLYPRFEPSFFPDNSTASGGIDISQLNRCAWDDGYTYPPAPEYDFDTAVCSNSVLSASYEIQWQGNEVIALVANFILGNISLDRDPSIPQTEPPSLEPAPPIARPTEAPTDGPSNTTTESQTEELSTIDSTTEETTVAATSMAVPTSFVITTPRPTPVNGTDSPPTSPPPDENTTLTGFPPFTQFFSVYYTYLNQPEENFETGILDPPELEERSGNPGYVFGKLVLTGKAIYQYPEVVENITAPINCTGNFTIDPPECNATEVTTFPPTEPAATFININTTDPYRLKLWNPGPGSLCSESSYRDIFFGEDITSGCIVRLGWSQFQNCTDLRNLMEGQLQQLFQADRIGKRGNSDPDVESDWAEIFNPIDHEYIAPIPTTGAPTTIPETSTPPWQREVVPEVTQTLEQIVGTCEDVPTGINVEILITETAEVRGMKQRAIMSARVNYTTSTLRLSCIGANGVSCYGDYASSYNHSDDEPVQSFVITSTVTFITVPPNEPEPVISYYENYTDVCKYDTCAWEAFYPMTIHNKGGDYYDNLGYGLFLVLVVLVYYVMTRPWF